MFEALSPVGFVVSVRSTTFFYHFDFKLFIQFL